MDLSISVKLVAAPICAKVGASLLLIRFNLTNIIALVGQELHAFLAKHTPAYDRIVYVGDGSNDFCPVIRLRRFVCSLSSSKVTD